MAEDIGIELHDKIKRAFDARCGKDSTLSHIKRKIENGTATMEDTSVYARRLGENLRKSIESTTKPDDLPGEKMYFNIAQSILEPLLRDNYEDVNGICAEVQRALDAKKGIGIAPQKADFPAERIRAAIGGAAVKETAEHAIQVLGRTAENITGSFQTDYIKKNAEFRSKAGLNCYIERKDGHNCCDWCTKLAGRYRYPDEVPKDVYRRHDNCTCDVSYVSEKGRRNVHTQQLNWSKEKNLEYLKQLDAEKKAKRAEYKANGKNLQKVRFKPSESAARRERIEYAADASMKYRAVKRSESSAFIARNNHTMTVRRVTTAVNNIYISDDVQIKPKHFHEIDKKLTEVYKLMGISSSDNRPTTYLISNNEMSGSRIIAASYRGHDNALFINKDHVLYSADTAPEEMKAFACYTDDRSTLVHELFHWKDAEEYRQKFGTIDPNDPSAYNKYVDEMCRKRLDKVLKKGYNISEISPYALEKLMQDDHTEPYTEYRTRKLLEGR